MTHSSRVICFMFYDWIRRISRYGWKDDESPKLGLWEDQGINIRLKGQIGGCSASSILLALEISTPWISS